MQCVSPRKWCCNDRYELLFCLQHGSHLLMDQVDCLERPNQYLKLDNLAFVVPLDHVDAVNVDALNLYLKLQHCLPRTSEFPDAPERLVEEHAEGTGEIMESNRLSDLRFVNNR